MEAASSTNCGSAYVDPTFRGDETSARELWRLLKGVGVWLQTQLRGLKGAGRQLPFYFSVA
jgi:hypothetical protein